MCGVVGDAALGPGKGPGLGRAGPRGRREEKQGCAEAPAPPVHRFVPLSVQQGVYGMPSAWETGTASCGNLIRMSDRRERILREVEALTDEMVGFTADLVRIPTVNPPGEFYEDCARLLGERRGRCGFEVEYPPAEGRPEHTPAYPRVNVVGTRRGRGPGPVVHLNGHIDVVPAGAGWTVDPFGGAVRDGKVWGRGTCDMKAGI